MERPILKPVGDQAILVVFGAEIDEKINTCVHTLNRSLQRSAPEGVLETTPAYSTLLVHFDPLKLSSAEVSAWVQSCLDHLEVGSEGEVRLVEVPVYYGGTAGPDLENVAKVHDISEAEVVQIHSQTEYRVFMMGFTPGFPYLGVVDERIATPRLQSPRTQVPAGSVGIAGKQTGVYPIESPGGWQLIGNTPMKLFDPMKSPPALFAPGDRVHFTPVDEDEVANGT